LRRLLEEQEEVFGRFERQNVFVMGLNKEQTSTLNQMSKLARQIEKS
jgi:hypothetical protein